MLDQAVQPRGQDVLGQAEVLLELAEPAQAVERVTDDQQRPAVADRVEWPGDRAARVLVACPLRERISYPRLVVSTFRLFAEVPVLRTRAILVLLIFAAFTVLVTPMVLPLSAPPFSLSTTDIGLFGLAGAAGALGASRAGRLSDAGHAQRVTGIGLGMMLLSWIPISLLPHSLWGLVIGLVAVDFGLQSVHVANQSIIYRTRPEAQSRLTAGYMVFYSIGSALGAITSTVVHAYAGWSGVCLLGAAISLTAVVFWTATRA